MPLRIKNIKRNSIAEKIGIKENDILLEINGNEIHDCLDYKFYTNDSFIHLLIKRGNQLLEDEFHKNIDEDLGVEFYPIKYRRCVCNCIFCFVDQMKPGSRASLNIKDDDYRLSFQFGNFITLVNMNKKDYQRIVRQKISPLYISVHTTNDKLRQRMMRYSNLSGTRQATELSRTEKFSILNRIQFLAKNGIRMHTQIVLVPDWNDGNELQKTVFDLVKFFPQIESIAIVPVGLTKYRQKLPKIKSVDKKISLQLIKDTEKWRRIFKQKHNKAILYLADEFFLLANYPIPQREYYEGFPQLENGVGMVRQLLDKCEESQYIRIKKPYKMKYQSITLLTAELIYPIIKKIGEHITNIYKIKVDVLPIVNNYLGRSITVTGLLSASDVIQQIHNREDLGEVIILPENMFNQEGITIDDYSISDIEQKIGKRCLIGKQDLSNLLESENYEL